MGEKKKNQRWINAPKSRYDRHLRFSLKYENYKLKLEFKFT